MIEYASFPMPALQSFGELSDETKVGLSHRTNALAIAKGWLA